MVVTMARASEQAAACWLVCKGMWCFMSYKVHGVLCGITQGVTCCSRVVNVARADRSQLAVCLASGDVQLVAQWRVTMAFGSVCTKVVGRVAKTRACNLHTGRPPLQHHNYIGDSGWDKTCAG
jgi:hypothetical protein